MKNYDPIVCAVCGQEDAVFYAEKNNFKYYRSQECGFIFVWPLLGSPPKEIYEDDYFSGAQKGFGYASYDLDKSAMRQLLLKFLKVMSAHLPQKGKLLDVGAATGYFVKLANENGWQAMGIDISEYSSREAQKQNVDVRCATLEEFDASRESFDAITLWDVIEHLPDPQKAVQKINKLLKRGGLLALVTPDNQSSWARFWGKRWHSLIPPEHISMFNKKALTMLLEKNGFEVLRTSNPVKSFPPAYIAMMASRWTGIALPKFLLNILELPLIRSLVVPVPIRDNVFLLARKRLTF